MSSAHLGNSRLGNATAVALPNRLDDIVISTRANWFLLTVLATGLIVGYEKFLQERLFPYINLAVVAGFYVILLLQFRGKLIKPHPIPATLFGAAVCFALAAQWLAFGVSALFWPHNIKIVAQFVLLLSALCLVTQQMARRLLRIVNVWIVVIASLTIPLVCFGRFALWSLEDLRSASIFHDPNYAGVIFGFSLLYTLTMSTMAARLRYPVIAVLALMLSATFSKGALLSIVIALCWLVLRKTPRLFLVLGPPVTWIASRSLTAILEWLNTHFPILRIGSGLNYRDRFWTDAFHAIVESPGVGHSQESLHAIIDHRAPGTDINSLHNYYMESAFLYGLPFTALVLCVLFFSFRGSMRAAPGINTLLVFLMVAANNFTFSIGSVGLLPFLFTFVAVYPFLRSETGSTPDVEPVRKSAGPEAAAPVFTADDGRTVYRLF